MAKAKKAQSLAARDQLVLKHLSLVKAIAVRVRENLPAHVDLDDLIQAGTMGLFDAARKFDPKKEVAFQAFAKYRIRGAILDSLRQLDWASRDSRRRYKQFDQAQSALAAELGRAPSESEIAAKMGLDLDQFRRMMLDLRQGGLISMSARDDEPAHDVPSGLKARPDTVTLESERSDQLRRALGILSPRYQKVIELYYLRELTMKEVGGALGVNESRVSQMHAIALEKLRAAMIHSGVDSPRALIAAA